MVKRNVNMSSIVIGFLLGVSLMLLVGATKYNEPHYQISAVQSGGSTDCWVIDTHTGEVCKNSSGKFHEWHPWKSLPEKGR